MELMRAHNQWMARKEDERFEDLDSLYAQVKARTEEASTWMTDVRGSRLFVEGVDEERITLEMADGRGVGFTPWSFHQLCQVYNAPSRYVSRLDPNLAVQCLEDNQRNLEENTNTYKMLMGSPTTLRAVTSPQYGRIWDHEVVEKCMEIKELNPEFYNPPAYCPFGGGHKPSGLYASDRDVFMFLIDGGSRLDVSERAKMNRGFFMWNSEVGSKTFGVSCFLFNEVCGNHIVWGATHVTEMIIKHSKKVRDRFDQIIDKVFKAYNIKHMHEEEEVIVTAINRKLPTGAKEIVDWTQSRLPTITRKQVNEAIRVATIEEGQCETVWDLVQGLTAIARDIPFMDKKVTIERGAGKLLNSM